jgi:2-keto-4-pentenoate hydratase/2-oxohepta-3-ene-1,7-dioic acid hydratase in catechol pathway
MTTARHSARIFCIGQNYVAHIRELGNPMPEAPVIFMRPLSCLVAPGAAVHFPRHGKELHYEVEVVVRIGKEGRGIDELDALTHIDALTLGADLTLRDLQIAAKKEGLPWDQAKAFEQSAPLGEFLAYDTDSIDLDNLNFRCRINGELRQDGNTNDMLFGFRRLIAELSSVWTLRPGDMIYSGTPSGVGPLQVGDTIEVENDQIGSFSWTIIE